MTLCWIESRNSRGQKGSRRLKASSRRRQAVAERIQGKFEEVGNIHSPSSYIPVCCGPVTDLALIKTEKTLRPKKPKQPARRPIVTPSLPPKKPRYHPSLKAAAPNKPRRKLLRRAGSTYPSWTMVLRRTARRAISARPVLIMRWTHCR